MPRQKKQHLKRRKDGYYVCRYKDQFFYGVTEDDAFAQREEYKELEQSKQTKLLAGLKVKEYAERWIKNAKTGTAKHTRNEAKIQMRKLTDQIGEKFLSEVKASDIKNVYSNEFIGLSDKYIRRAAQLYRSFFDAALDDGYISKNPARQNSSKPHKGTTGSHRAITAQEREWIDTLCLDHRARPAVMAMLYAGIRPQEAKALNIDNAVDLKKDEITLSAFVHLDNYNQYKVTNKGKYDKAARTIPLFRPLKDALKDKHGLLIPSAKGKQITVTGWKTVYASYVHDMETAINGVSKRWYGKTKEHKKILNSGGKLPEWINFTVVPYDLRHSFCVMCRDNGVELNTCVRWMGHSDAKMILKIYDEVSDDRSKIEAEKLNKKLFRSANGSINDNEDAENVEK